MLSNSVQGTLFALPIKRIKRDHLILILIHQLHSSHPSSPGNLLTLNASPSTRPPQGRSPIPRDDLLGTPLGGRQLPNQIPLQPLPLKLLLRDLLYRSLPCCFTLLT